MSSSSIAFPTFNSFPPEIRCQIWRASVPDYRLVPIKYQRDTCSYVPRIGPPAILQVNRESRREGLAIYHELRLGPVPVKDCYVDLTRDIVYLKSDLHDLGNREDAFVLPENNMGHRGRLPSPPLRQSAATLPPLTHPSPTAEEPGEDEAYPLRHSKIILYDLLTSADGHAVLRTLHVTSGTWSAIRRYYRYQRHRLSARLEHLVLVYERGSGPLSEDIQLKPIHWQEQEPGLETPPNYLEDRIASRMSRSFRAESILVNRKDQSNGLRPVLNFTVEAKSLDRDGTSLYNRV